MILVDDDPIIRSMEKSGFPPWMRVGGEAEECFI